MDAGERVYRCVHKFERGARPVALVLVLAVYTLFGAYLFHMIEETHELRRGARQRDAVRDLRELFVSRVHAVYNERE